MTTLSRVSGAYSIDRTVVDRRDVRWTYRQPQGRASVWSLAAPTCLSASRSQDPRIGSWASSIDRQAASANLQNGIQKKSNYQASPKMCSCLAVSVETDRPKTFRPTQVHWKLPFSPAWQTSPWRSRGRACGAAKSKTRRHSLQRKLE